MKNGKKLLAILLSLCMVFALLAGCGDSKSGADNTNPSPASSAPEASPDSGEPAKSGYLRDKITVSSKFDGGSFDPWVRSSWGDCIMQDLIFQHLANIDTDGTFCYEIAKSFDKVDDTHYTLVIWDNIVDTAGNKITADDIIWSFDQYIAAGNQGGVNRFDHFEKIDDYTLTWVCSAPFTAGEMGKNLSNCKICSKASYEASGNDMTTKPVGSGPYKLKEYTPGSVVVLEANEDFWMNDLDIELSKWELQNVKEIEYQIILDASSRAIALELGDIDIADSLDAADINAFAGNPDISNILMPQGAPIAFIFNCSDNSPFADVNLRKAVCYALDNQAIVDALAVPAEAVYGIQPLMWDAPDSWLDGRDYYDYNEAKAKELLEASSYNGEPLVLQYTSSTALDGTVLMVQSQLNKLGIKVELLNLEDSVRNIEKFKPDTWDFRFEIMGGGNYLTQVLKCFSSQDASAHLEGGLQIMMVPDEKLDQLWDALYKDTNEKTIEAWDEYFTYEQCYAYAIAYYSEQSCCRSYVNAVQAGTRSNVVPNACTFND